MTGALSQSLSEATAACVKKDTCQAPPGSPNGKTEGGAPKPPAREPQPRPKSDPGLKKVLSEAAGVLREALKGSVPEPEAQPEPSSSTPKAGGSSEQMTPAARAAMDPPIMATAAKIEAQLQDLEARVLEGQARIRAVDASVGDSAQEQTALLDSGATHTVLNPTAVSQSCLAPCMVSLAGDQKQMWSQTPGGSLVAPPKLEGGETQTILPLGSLIEQLGCSIRWTKRGGLQLMHPRLGRLETSIRSGCPQLSKRQALQLVKELEGAHIGELEGRLRAVQSQLAVQTHQEFHVVLDEFVATGSWRSAQSLVDHLPFLEHVPGRITTKLAVGLDNLQGWEALKAFPVNRRTRKRLHSSTAWVPSLCSGKGDPRLRYYCQEQGYELLEVDLINSKGWDL